MRLIAAFLLVAAVHAACAAVAIGMGEHVAREAAKASILILGAANALIVAYMLEKMQ